MRWGVPKGVVGGTRGGGYEVGYIGWRVVWGALMSVYCR